MIVVLWMLLIAGTMWKGYKYPPGGTPVEISKDDPGELQECPFIMLMLKKTEINICIIEEEMHPEHGLFKLKKIVSETTVHLGFREGPEVLTVRPGTKLLTGLPGPELLTVRPAGTTDRPGSLTDRLGAPEPLTGRRRSCGLLTGRPGPPELPTGRPEPPELPTGRPGPPELPIGRPGPPELPIGRPGPPELPTGRPEPPEPLVGRPGQPELPAGRPRPLVPLTVRPGGFKSLVGFLVPLTDRSGPELELPFWRLGTGPELTVGRAVPVLGLPGAELELLPGCLTPGLLALSCGVTMGPGLEQLG
eukprot:bmy_03630T0